MRFVILLCVIGSILANDSLEDYSDSDEDVTVKTPVTVPTTRPTTRKPKRDPISEPTTIQPAEDDPIPEPRTSNQSEKNAIESMDKALIAYDATFKQCAPWTNFHQQLQKHIRNKHFYTSRSGELAGQIMTSLLSVDSQYFQATMAIYGWCGETLPLLDGYESLFDGTEKSNIDGQKELLLAITDKKEILDLLECGIDLQ